MSIRRFRDWKIRTKLVSITLVMVMAPLVFAAFLSVNKFTRSLKEAAEADLEHVVNGLFLLCRAQEEILGQKVDKDLEVARSVLEGFGERARLDAAHTVTLPLRDEPEAPPARTIQVPLLLIGGQPILGDERIVDRIGALTDAACTLFQWVPGVGLVRLSTTVRNRFGERAVGTFLPPSSEVAATLLSGAPFRGRAFAVGDWYITAYEPLLDEAGALIGALGVGVRGAESAALRRAMQVIRIGKTGYPYVIDSAGTLVFHPTSPGANIIDEQDSDGNHFIRRMCQDARHLEEGQVGTIRYPWINPALGETRPRYKIVKYQYFRDWDWIIAAGSYEEEIFGAIRETKTYISVVAVTATILVVALTLMLSSVFTRPLQELTTAARAMADGDLEQTVRADRADEIGELGESFNAMAEQIRNQTVNLERMVYQRTKQLAESRERYRNTSHMLNNILQASTEYAIIATDLEGTIVEYNTGARLIYGWTPEETVGRQKLSATFPYREDWNGSFIRWIRSRLDESGVGEFQTIRERRNGEQFPVHAIVTLIRNPDGEEIGFLEISRDITEECKLQRELQETRDHLRSIVESSVDVIVTADQQGKITFLNPAVEEVLGYGREELLGRHVSMLYERGIDEAWDIMEQLACKGVVRNHELRMFRKDGSLVPILTSAGLLRDPANRVIGTVGIFTDISQRKKLEAELHKAQQSLVQAVKLKAIGDLVAGVAHEINNPLMAAGAILHVLLEQKDRFDEATVKRLGLLQKVHERIGGIVNHLRDFSRQSDAALTPMPIHAAIHNALLITRQQLLNHQIELDLDLDENLPEILGDRNQLEQVFLNLIANARDAMDERGGEKRLTLRTRVQPVDGWPHVVAEVTDTGNGIPESVLPKIFDPFFSTKEVGQGTGLGLSICYGIVEAHGGKISVESQVGRGTTVRVSIPAAGRREATEPRPADPATSA